MTTIEKELLSIVTAALTNDLYITRPDIDYAAVLDEALTQSVYGLVYPFVSDAIDKTVKSQYEDLFFSGVVQNTMVESGHAVVHELMTKNRIPYVTIKGSASAKYYPDPSLRSMGDVDFLVNKLDFEKAVDLTLSEGFLPEEEESSLRHRALRKGTVIWEIHHTIGGLPGGIVGKICLNKLSGIIKDSVLYHTESGDFLIPNEYYHGLVMLLHVTGHITSTGVGLRHICDWAVFVNSMTDEVFTEMFQKDLKEIGLWHFAKVLTALSVKYLGIPERSFAKGIDDNLLSDMMEDILGGGNFGKKDKDRYHSSMLNSKKSENSLVGNMFRTLNERAKVRMPITEKAPVLLPIGWIYVGVNHLAMIRKGQRPAIHPKQTLEKSAKRRDLNKSYKLFEIENCN